MAAKRKRALRFTRDSDLDLRVAEWRSQQKMSRKRCWERETGDKGIGGSLGDRVREKIVGRPVGERIGGGVGERADEGFGRRFGDRVGKEVGGRVNGEIGEGSVSQSDAGDKGRGGGGKLGFSI